MIHTSPLFIFYWFTSELRRMKAAGRVIERRHKSTALTVHRSAYREHQKSLKEARSRFYSNIIQKHPGNSTQLFSTIHHLLKPQTSTLTGLREEHCNKFIESFKTKTDNIRLALSGPSNTDPTVRDLQAAVLLSRGNASGDQGHY